MRKLLVVLLLLGLAAAAADARGIPQRRVLLRAAPAAATVAAGIDFTTNALTGCAAVSDCLTVTRASAETVTDSSGNLTYAANNTLAQSNAGLQVWQAATNLTTQSNMASAWTTFQSSFGSSGLAPDGTTTARPVIAANTSNIHVITSTGFTATAAVYTWSIYVKSNGTYNFASVGATSGSGNIRYVPVVDLTTGAITQTCTQGTTTGAGASTTKYANGWIRVQIQMTATTTASSTNMQVGPSNSGTPTCTVNGNPTYTGDGTSAVYFWGGQIELGSFATPLIPTTTTSAARAADNVVAAGLLATYLAAPKGTVTVATNLSQASANAALLGSQGTIELAKYSNNTCTSILTQPLASTTIATWTGAVTCALTWTASSGALSLNGATAVSDAFVRAPGGTFQIGSVNGSSLFLNGNITSITASTTVPSYPAPAAAHYVDAITGGGSDAAAGTSASAPWATLAHANAALTANDPALYIRFPDGSWRSVAPIWTGFYSYYPGVKGSYPGLSATVLYDVYNTHNGTIGAATWLTGGGWSDTYAVSFNASVANWPAGVCGASCSALAMVLAQYNWTDQGGAGFMVGTTTRVGFQTPLSSDLIAHWDFVNTTTGRLNYTPSGTGNAFNVWGALAGSSSQYIYQNGIQRASAGSNQTWTPAGDTTLYIGQSPNATIGKYNSNIYGLMVKNATLATADYVILQSWLTSTEVPRIAPLSYGRLATLQPSSPLVTVPANGLETLPAMGWDSWRVYGVNATDANIRANCLAMTSNGMLAAGYTYCGPSGNFATSGRDYAGNLITNATLFPNGMAALGTYIHGLGLKYSMYLSPASTGCASFTGSAGYETADATLIAGFGADLLMYDNCTAFNGNNYAQYAYQKMGQALQATGRPIVYRVSAPNATISASFWNSLTWCATVGGNECASSPDRGGTTFASLVLYIHDQIAATPGQPGRWNWPDFLSVGNGTLTDTEGQTDMAMFCIFPSPLILSVNLATISAPSLATVLNANAIAVNQDNGGHAGAQLSSTACGSATCEVWIRQLNGSPKQWAIVFLNTASTSQTISLNWSALPGAPAGPFTGFDIWNNTSLGSLATGYSVSVASHGTAFFTLQ